MVAREDRLLYTASFELAQGYSRVTNMNYELAKKLKDAEFPKSSPRYVDEIGRGIYIDHEKKESVYFPTLSELIEACGEHLVDLKRVVNEHGVIWRAQGNAEPKNYPDWGYSMAASTPEEAVANLYLALHEK